MTRPLARPATALALLAPAFLAPLPATAADAPPGADGQARPLIDLTGIF